MNQTLLPKIGIALVSFAAIASVFMSQAAFAQGDGGETGFAALIGRERIRTDDPRFRPAAVLVVHEATDPALAKGRWAFLERVFIDMHTRTVLQIPGLARGGQSPRPLTAMEAAFLEELFSHDLSKARGAEITKNGLSGEIRPQDLDIKPSDLIARAKARAAAKSKWYSEGAQGLGPG